MREQTYVSLLRKPFKYMQESPRNQVYLTVDKPAQRHVVTKYFRASPALQEASSLSPRAVTRPQPSVPMSPWSTPLCARVRVPLGPGTSTASRSLVPLHGCQTSQRLWGEGAAVVPACTFLVSYPLVDRDSLRERLLREGAEGG